MHPALLSSLPLPISIAVFLVLVVFFVIAVTPKGTKIP